MKHSKSLFVLAITSFFFALPALAAPQLAFDKPVHDFNTAIEGAKLPHSFTFRNTGREPVYIERISSSCGCTVAEVSERVIQPGRKGEIKATFDTTGFSGQVKKEIYVYLKGVKAPGNTLTIKGTVMEELVASPRQLNLGDIKHGVKKDGSIKFKNQGKRTVRIINVKSMSQQIKASAGKRTLKPGESTTIKIAVTPDKGGGYFGGYVTIVTDAPENKEKNIPIYATVR